MRRKRAEEDGKRLVTQLIESRRLFQQMAETTPDVLHIYDFADGRMSYVSARAQQVIGYTPHDLIERGSGFASELWHPDDVARLPEYRRRLQALGDNDVHESEYRVRQPDGGYRWLRSRVAPFSRDAEGHIRQIIGVTQNITESKRAEEALRESERRFRRYFELGVIGMAITSAAKAILDVNDEMCRILGYERHELLQKTWAELMHPEDLAADIAQFDRVMNGEIDGYAIDKRWIRKNGATIFATISVKCVRRADGSVEYFLGLLEDITERKRAEETLARAHDELEQRLMQSEAMLHRYREELQDLTTRLIEAQELQSKHLARELHDVFSQRLAAIGMDIEHIAQHTANSRHALEDALHSVMQSVNELATDIHRMSRQLHPAIVEDLGLSAAIKSACLAFSEQYGMPAEFLSVDVPQRVAEDVALCLYRVAQESLRNIAKHAGKATVHVTLRGSTDHIWLTVMDDGIGFDVEKVKRTRGLGLVSMEERVRIVGGSLSLTTVPGDGARIEAQVPLRRPDGRRTAVPHEGCHPLVGRRP